jgi:hypothetical protein
MPVAGTYTTRNEETVGILDDAAETVGAAAKKVSRSVEDTVDRLKDKADETKAEADVKKAQAEADSVKKRNEVKEGLRD